MALLPRRQHGSTSEILMTHYRMSCTTIHNVHKASPGNTGGSQALLLVRRHGVAQYAVKTDTGCRQNAKLTMCDSHGALHDGVEIQINNPDSGTTYSFLSVNGSVEGPDPRNYLGSCSHGDRFYHGHGGHVGRQGVLSYGHGNATQSTRECTSLMSSLEHIDYLLYRKFSVFLAYLRCWISRSFTFIFDFAISSLVSVLTIS